MEQTAEKFDPEIHQTDGEGQPVVKGDGSFARKRGPKSAPRAASSPRRPKAATPRAGTRPKAPDFRPGLNGMFQLAAAPLAFVQPLDAYAVATHGPNIAEALNDLAQERPEVAAVLQRILAVGPYGAVIAAVVPLVVQVLHNHDMLPEEAAGRIPGVTPKSTLLEALGGAQETVEGPREHPQHEAPGWDGEIKFPGRADNVVTVDTRFVGASDNDVMQNPARVV